MLFAAPTLAMVTCFAIYGSGEHSGCSYCRKPASWLHAQVPGRCTGWPLPCAATASSPSLPAPCLPCLPSSPSPAVSPDSFTPASIFTSIALFGLMRFPLVFLPFALIQLSNALVSMRRLSAYFCLEERSEQVERLDRPGERRGSARCAVLRCAVMCCAGLGWAGVSSKLCVCPWVLRRVAGCGEPTKRARLPIKSLTRLPPLPLYPGLEIVDGNFYWAEPPPKKPEPGKKGGPPGSKPGSQPGSKAPSRKGSFFKRSNSKQALEEGAANGKAANGEAVAVELPAMKEDKGEGAANGTSNGAAHGASAPASPEKPVGDDLSDSAQEGPGSSGPPSPPPEKAKGGKEGAWWLRGVNLRVRRGVGDCVARACWAGFGAQGGA